MPGHTLSIAAILSPIGLLLAYFRRHFHFELLIIGRLR
jgi:hypothetical protein